MFLGIRKPWLLQYVSQRAHHVLKEQVFSRCGTDYDYAALSAQSMITTKSTHAKSLPRGSPCLDHCDSL